MTTRTATRPPVAPAVFVEALPENITPIDTQADLYGYGVVTLGYLEVADKAEAVERAEGRRAFLLKSNIRPVYYLIFPHVIYKKGSSKP